MAAHQASLSLGFSRQEHWNGLPFPSPVHEKWKVKGKSLSRVWFFATPWTEAHQSPASMGFSRREYWSGVPSPSASPRLLKSLITPYGTGFSVCEMARIYHTHLWVLLWCITCYWYLSILSVSLGKSTARHSNCSITYMCLCGCFTLHSWGSRLNTGLLGCGQMDFIFLTLLELDYSLGNCFFFCDNPQTSELITDNQISKQTKGFNCKHETSNILSKWEDYITWHCYISKQNVRNRLHICYRVINTACLPYLTGGE